jgi:Acetyltransferase (GNAT) domain
MSARVAKNGKPAARIECRGMTADEKPAYLQFARKAWGTDWPQAEPSFLAWLYKENPNTQGMERDLLVLVDDGRIVGSHHRMRVPWRVNGNRFIVPSLHDLAVLPEYRKPAGDQGLVPPGLKIMFAALEKEAHVGLFGMTDVADKIYERLHVPDTKLFWLEKIRSRIKAGLQLTTSRLGMNPRISPPVGRGTSRSQDYEIARIPNPADEEIAEALSVKPSPQTHPDWDLESYRWRFFHKLGPRNLLLIARRNSTPVGRAVISLGLKSGIFVGRVVDLAFQEENCLQVLVNEIGQTFSHLNAPVCLAVTSSQQVADRFRASGWKYRKQSGGSRWFSGRGTERPQDFWICGGAWDFGCDTRIGD